jgi:antitoxin Phd
MQIDTKMIVSFSQAKKNFSHVTRIADSYGHAVILKDNKPKYLLIDLEQELLIYDLTDEEKLEIASKRILKQYKPAFEELSKEDNQ